MIAIALLPLLAILSILSSSNAAYCSGTPDAGERVSNFPIFDQKSLRFKRQIKNAMLFEAGPENASFPVVHLWGTPYEQGYAQGTLMKETVTGFITKTWAYLISEVVNFYFHKNKSHNNIC